MGKTTNILDLNNRLTKVEKVNVAQNSYTSLKNKPKINSVTLSGNKSLADIGAVAAADVGDKTQLNTTDKSSTVAAINEVNKKIDTLIMTQEFNTTIDSIAGNIDATVEIPVTVPSGYKILGIAAALSGSRNLAITGTSVGVNSVSTYVYNLFSVTLSNIKVYVLVEFIKI